MGTGARPWRFCGALFLLAAHNAGAVNWVVTPDITLRETYTDNVFIGTGTSRDDFVTEITPGIRIEGRGPRLDATFDYRPTAVLYARTNEEDYIANNLSAFGRLEAVENFFFVEASAYVSQTFLSPFAPQPPGLATSTRNRAESSSFVLSPYVRGELRSGHEYELRNTNAWTRVDEREVNEFHTRRWFGRLASPVRLFGWSVEYDERVWERETVARAPDQESRIFRTRLYYQPKPEWRFSASVGREENNYERRDELQSEDIYGAGVTWRPGPRTRAEFYYEHRFFGDAPLVRLSHRTRLTAWELSYVRDTTNFQEEVLRLPPGNVAGLLDSIFAARVPDPQQRRALVQEFVRVNGIPPFLSTPLSFFTESQYLREALNASFAILGVRNSITFTAFYEENTRLSSEVAALPGDPFTLADRFSQRGFGARADHKLTPQTTLGASVTRTYAREEEPVEFESRTDYFALTLNRTISPQTTAFAGVSATWFDSDAVGPEDQANSIFVGMYHRF